MDTDELHAILEEAGLSPYQADAYATLLELGSAPASEIASASGVPQPRIYDILRTLEDEGYVTTYDRDRLFAQANDPDDALSGLKGAVQRYESAIEEIESRYQDPEGQDGDVSLVRRFETVFGHAREAITAATDHIQLAVTPSQFLDLRTELRDAHQRGVFIQVSLHLPPDEQLPFDQSEFEGVCTEVRRRELQGPFLLLVDRQRVCYASGNNLFDDYGILVDDYTTAHVFHWYYLTRYWEVYDKLYNDRNEEPPFSFVEITACVRAIESLLDKGATIQGRAVGEFVRTGQDFDLSGEVTGVDYTGARMDDTPASLVQLAAEARIQFKADGDTYIVGGRGAYTEDIAARRFVIQHIEYPEDSEA